MNRFIVGFACGMVFPFAAAFIIGGIQDWLGRKHWLGFGEYRTLMYFPTGVRMDVVERQRKLGHRIVRILPRLWWFSHRPELLDAQIKARQEEEDRLRRESQARLAELRAQAKAREAELESQAKQPDATPGNQEDGPGVRSDSGA